MEAVLAGKPLLIWSLEAMAAVCARIIVVAGYAPERIFRLVQDRPGTEVIINENFAGGMLTSIQAGIALVRTGRFFVMPGDMPLVTAPVYRKLLTVKAKIAVPIAQGRRGHPVLLAASLIGALLDEPLDSSLARFIAGREFATVEVDDPGIFTDLDEGDDIKKMDALLRTGGKNE